MEQKDATPAQLAIREINTGFIAAPATKLRHWVASLDNNNAQGEFYLTDVVARAVTDGVSVRGICTESRQEVLGINDRVQLAGQERAYQRRQAAACLEAGVTLIDPERFDLRGSLEAGQDVLIDINCVLQGRVVLGDGVQLGPNVVIRDTTVGDHVTVLANSVIEDAVIGNHARIGPFARIRPETRLADSTHVGNFVEIKKSQIGRGSKVNHLSYIGDTDVGEGVNIGAGTITCNYDGANKHKTVIADNAFIGSNTALVAPVTVGPNATIGAGSVISRDAPQDKLTLTRAKQLSLNWKRPTKQK